MSNSTNTTTELREKAIALKAQLAKIQESKGYFFNKDEEHTLDVIEQLIANKERYGYMACPCRLSSGKRNFDVDIICPCSYRKEDVQEFGSCYCGLYVTEDWNNNKIEHKYIPERRPLDLMFQD